MPAALSEMAERRTAIITGANAGLGLECSRAVLAADPGWHVVLAVRDPERGAGAVADLGAPERCTVMHLDLASLASVREFAETFAADESLRPLRAIVCNAGIQVISGTRYTADRVELMFGVNHLGHFALVNALLDSLETPARIVVVSSDTHDPSERTGMPKPVYTSADELAHPPESADGNGGGVALGRLRYTTSKLCNILFAYELNRRLGDGERGITVNAFNPGLMPGSGLARDYGPLQRLAWRFVMPALRVLPQVHSTKESGRNLAALVSDARYADITGQYIDGAKAARSSNDSYDRVKARDLWESSERLVSDLRGTDTALT